MEGRDQSAVYPVEFLEIRQRRGGGRTLTGAFKYGSTATIRDRGRTRKERFAKRAFRYTVSGKGRDRDVSLLAGHDFNRPLAGRRAGSLELAETDAALTFRAALPPEAGQPSWMRDQILAIDADLVGGISPGFSVPPKSVVPNAERLIPEPGNPSVSIRVIEQAVLYEVSLVSRPAYGDTELDLRAWEGMIGDDALGAGDRSDVQIFPAGEDPAEPRARGVRLWL